MLSAEPSTPIMVRPVPGCGWWPVMAVVELSRMHTMMSCWLYTALTTPVMPLAKNVESPTKPNAIVSSSMVSMPCGTVMPAPMHRQVSTMSSGCALPSV